MRATSEFKLLDLLEQSQGAAAIEFCDFTRKRRKWRTHGTSHVPLVTEESTEVEKGINFRLNPGGRRNIFEVPVLWP